MGMGMRGPWKWELWYSDGSCVAGTTREEWIAAPSEDVQFLVVQYPTGHMERLFDLDEYPLFKIPKYGKWTTRENYVRVRTKMNNESKIFNPPPPSVE